MIIERVEPLRLTPLLVSLFFFAVSVGAGLSVMEWLLRPQSADQRLLHLSRQANLLYCTVVSASELCMRGTPDGDTPDVAPPAVEAVAIPHHPVFGTLHWQGGSEADAAAFMATAKTLAMLHFEKEHKYLRKEIEQLIAPVWRDYPAIVSASACLYCGDITDVVLNLMREQALSPQWVKNVARGVSRYLPLLIEREALSDEEAYRLAVIQALLGNAGDPRVAKAVAAPLIRHNDMRHLTIWVMKGLNGGRAITDREMLEQLPLEVVVQAWRHGVSLGYDTPELTEYLLQHGYRPALRWLVWLQDGSATYLTDNHSTYRQHAQHYEQMMKEFTDFPVRRGGEVGAYYSERWRRINWDPYLKRWLYEG